MEPFKKMSQIRELTDAELALREQDLRKELFALRSQIKAGTLKNIALLKHYRKEIAQCLTEQTIRSKKA